VPTPDRSRAWERALERLPETAGALVLDLGCGAGDAASVLAERGAEVIGLDLDAARVQAARARRIPRAEFRVADLRAPLELERPADGLWAAYTAAYFPDLAPVLERWSCALRPGGWIALVEIDDFLGHEPLSSEARAWLAGYAAEALGEGRYDFRCGSKLERHVADAGLRLEWSCEFPDPEYAWQGPLDAPALASWRARLQRMPLMRAAAGERAERLCEELLACLAHPEHRTRARVRACLARTSD
jgi:SAM-dependent methyltransferase